MEWLSTSWHGMPYWGWSLIVLGVVTEKVLGQMKDERFRSGADAVRNLLGLALSRVPGIGGPLLTLLRMFYVVPKPKQPPMFPPPPASDEAAPK